MSEQKENTNTAVAPAPLQDKTPAPPAEGNRASKSYAELLLGFAEITKLQMNQEIFEKRKKNIPDPAQTKKNPDMAEHAKN